MPISFRLPEDKRLWHYSRKGDFTVMSAYHLCLTTKNRQERGTSRTSISNGWTKLLNLKVPPKVRHFAWRLLHHFLAVRDKISRWGLVIDDLCCLCGAGRETSIHLFCECSWVRGLWFVNPIGCRMDSGCYETMLEWFNKLEEHESGEVVELAVMTA